MHYVSSPSVILENNGKQVTHRIGNKMVGIPSGVSIMTDFCPDTTLTPFVHRINPMVPKLVVCSPSGELEEDYSPLRGSGPEMSAPQVPQRLQCCQEPFKLGGLHWPPGGSQPPCILHIFPHIFFQGSK